MISLHHSFVIDHIEDKKIPTRNGDTFEFTEVTMYTKGKYPTWLQARLESPDMKLHCLVGKNMLWIFQLVRGNQTMAVYSRASLFVALLQLTLNR